MIETPADDAARSSRLLHHLRDAVSDFPLDQFERVVLEGAVPPQGSTYPPAGHTYPRKGDA
ncbi:hypothetical protein OG599_35365 (plasmid) [Streptomyces sp. NBC_01335]|uniref:hypothetical protein n=1 Tax=Streptomyces sp. NBC_01335 TaxID=2903828 RepID=UPI002E151D01|nr:hypothetical protein OG599_35365 [Streptomyces sp. NBC_01335]